jgi:Lon-like protease
LNLIKIDGKQTQPVSGDLMLTTVQLQPITVAQAIRSWFDSDYEVFPRSVFVPPGQTEEQADEHTALQMEESQQFAAIAALELLGYDVKTTSLGARIVDVTKGVPASSVLEPGDVIVGADTKSVKKTEDLVSVIRGHKVGDEIVLKVKRDGETLTLRTRTIPRAEDASVPQIGVTLDTLTHSELPLAIDIQSLGIGGPSAGLMYALGITDLLDKPDLTAGRRIAGTGEITPDGAVGPVGGVAQKIASARAAGAELFLVPNDELEQACERAGDMQVAGVTNLKEAVRVLKEEAFAHERSCA